MTSSLELTLGTSLSLVRGTEPNLNDTLRCAIFVVQAFEFDFIFKNMEFSSLLFSFEHCNFYLFFYLFLS